MKKVLAIFLALWMLFAGSNITLATHYCGNKAVKSTFSLGKDALSCGMKPMDRSCENEMQQPSAQRKGCCENQYVQVNVDSEVETPAAVKCNTNMDRAVIMGLSHSLFQSTLPVVAVIKFNYPPPPLLKRDIPVLVRSFLI